jgi:hypothetical protein
LAPDLVKIQRYFENEGDVVFISLTPDSDVRAARFAHRYSVDWSVGWGAGPFVDSYLGDVYPALVVIGRDGRVAWNDGAARLRHREAEIAAELFEQIEKSLAVHR